MAWRGSGVRIPSAPQSSRRSEAVSDPSLMVAVQLGEGLHRASAEYAALDFAAVVLERVVQVHGGGLGGCFGLPVPDGAVDGAMYRVVRDGAEAVDRMRVRLNASHVELW